MIGKPLGEAAPTPTGSGSSVRRPLDLLLSATPSRPGSAPSGRKETLGGAACQGVAKRDPRSVRLRPRPRVGSESSVLARQLDALPPTYRPDVAVIIVGGNDVTHRVPVDDLGAAPRSGDRPAATAGRRRRGRHLPRPRRAAPGAAAAPRARLAAVAAARRGPARRPRLAPVRTRCRSRTSSGRSSSPTPTRCSAWTDSIRARRLPADGRGAPAVGARRARLVEERGAVSGTAVPSRSAGLAIPPREPRPRLDTGPAPHRRRTPDDDRANQAARLAQLAVRPGPVPARSRPARLVAARRLGRRLEGRPGRPARHPADPDRLPVPAGRRQPRRRHRGRVRLLRPDVPAVHARRARRAVRLVARRDGHAAHHGQAVVLEGVQHRRRHHRRQPAAAVVTFAAATPSARSASWPP